MATNTPEYMRAWRAKNGANTGAVGRPVTAPCGTVSAYKRHLRRGEVVCDPCRDAHTAKQREYRKARLAKKES